MNGKIFLLDCQNCLSPSKDFIFYIGFDNHLITNTVSTCARARIFKYEANY